MKNIEEDIKRELEHTGGTLFKNVQKIEDYYVFCITLKDDESLNIENSDFECLSVTEKIEGKRVIVLKTSLTYTANLDNLQSILKNK